MEEQEAPPRGPEMKAGYRIETQFTCSRSPPRKLLGPEMKAGYRIETVFPHLDALVQSIGTRDEGGLPH